MKSSFSNKFVTFIAKTTNRLSSEELANGRAMFARIYGSFGKEFQGCSLSEALQQVDNVFASALRDYTRFSATVPVLLEQPGSKVEVIGSGVLLKIVDRVFLLTAAHVTDRATDGILLIPGRNSFIQPTGNFANMKTPISGDRKEDKLDVAYFWLDDDCVSNLDPSCAILEKNDLSSVGSDYQSFYTFAGYPWRKSRVKGKGIETNFSTYTGPEVQENVYKSLGLKRSRHIVIKFNRKRAFNRGNNRTIEAPHPSGVSGGGVHRWEEGALKKQSPHLPLAGIANEFNSEKSLLIATRLNVYMNCIFQNQPDLEAIAARVPHS